MPTARCAVMAAVLALALAPSASAARATALGGPVDGGTASRSVFADDGGAIVLARTSGSGVADTSLVWLGTGRPARGTLEGGFVGRAEPGFSADANARGDAVAAWIEPADPNAGRSSVVRAAVRSPGGRFGEPFVVAAPSGPLMGVDVDVAADGAAGIAFVEYPGGSAGEPRVSLRRAGEPFRPAVGPPGETNVSYANPAVAVAPGGAALLVHQGTEVRATRFAADGTPSAPTTVIPPDDDPSPWKLASTPRGRVAVVWTAVRESGEDTIGVSAGTVAGGVPLGTTYSRRSPRGLVFDIGDRGAVLAWTEYDRRTRSRIAALQVSAGGKAGRPRVVSGERTRYPEVAVDGRGNATVAWQAGHLERRAIDAVTSRGGGAFGRPQRLVGPRAEIGALALGATRDRTWVLAQREFRRVDHYLVARRSGGGRLRPATRVATAEAPFFDDDSTHPAVATTDTRAVAVWHTILRGFRGDRFYAFGLAP